MALTPAALLAHGKLSKVIYSVLGAVLMGAGTILVNNQSRIAVLEADTVQETSRLERIENKIDSLLERGNTHAN